MITTYHYLDKLVDSEAAPIIMDLLSPENFGGRPMRWLALNQEYFLIECESHIVQIPIEILKPLLPRYTIQSLIEGTDDNVKQILQ